MDGQVPDQYQLGPVAGVLRDYDSLGCLTNELLELLRHRDDDGAGSSGAAHGSSDEKLPPTPPPATAPTNIASDKLILSTAREAEMVSWLCQVFEDGACGHEQQRAATTKPGGSSSTAHGSSDSGHGARDAATGAASSDGVAEANAAIKVECCRGRRHRSRSWSFAGRAAEQRRRDKLNEKLRTLHQLVPSCKKTDKASTLEEVIHYVKFLQHQLQVSNGYAMQTAMILPPGGVVPPPCMQPAGDAFGTQPVIMLPRSPFVPAMFACPHHGNDGAPLPPPLYHHPAVGISATQQVLDHHRIISDLAVAPRRRKADSRTTKLKEKAEMSARSNRTDPPM